MATDVCILLDEKYEYKKLANFIIAMISAMKFHHFTARPIAEINVLGWLKLIIVFKIYLNLLYYDKVPHINPFTVFDENNAISIYILS